VFEEVAVHGKNKQQTKEKTWNEKLLSLYITLPDTNFYSIIALLSCISFVFNLCFKKL